MSTLEIKGKDGKVVGKHELKDALASVKVAPALLHRAVVSEEANARQGTQAAKTRSEVRGGGRKPYKQKKTGNARQGSTRAPHYAHGSMALAVKPRDYTKQVNKKERRQAILGALHDKVIKGDILVVDSISFSAPKTKDAAALLQAQGLADTRRVLVVLPSYDAVTLKCFNNIPGVVVRTAPSKSTEEKTQAFSARDVLVSHKVLIAKDALAKIEEVWS